MNLAVPSLLLLLLAQESPKPTEAAAAEAAFVCPPCGAECHFRTYPKAGNCGNCGMTLVPLASVPQIGVLLHPQAGLMTTTLTLSVFAGADVARAFTVADTAQALRLGDTLELKPQFTFADSPALDVLVVPDGFGAWDDELVVEWVKKQAEHARFVLAVDTGSVVLARAGLLASGERVPASKFLAQRGKELASDVVFDAGTSWRRSGRLFLARDAGGAVDAALAIVAELGGVERARRTAERMGHAWTPAPADAGEPQKQ